MAIASNSELFLLINFYVLLFPICKFVKVIKKYLILTGEMYFLLMRENLQKEERIK